VVETMLVVVAVLVVVLVVVLSMKCTFDFVGCGKEVLKMVSLQ
jgi:hypothetical protein